MKTGGIFAVILLFVGPPAFAGSVNGNGALALAALIADRSPSLTRAERVLLSAYLDGRPKMDFPRSKKIILRANAVVCRIGNVDITAKNCNLTFGGQTISLVGRQAQALYERWSSPSGRAIRHLFKLYAWEWMFADPFGNAPAISTTRFVEPPWKMILSNKGMLALLWEMAPEHPNLLPCYFEDDAEASRLRRYARKPLYSREGADIELVGPGGCVTGTRDGYGAEGFVRQELSPLPQFDGKYAVIGCWVVGDEPAGMGLREEASPITTNRACFVPHVILG